ncbi:MAG: alkaline phosphatase family protein [Desulfarculus sp.]|nr:alkaline phosphatase family protein [Desulfarculus sp.]
MAKLLFIGLDGVGLDLARHLVRIGVTPHLGELMDRAGAWATNSPLPEVSPVCWTSLFSGQGPGWHGVFGFGEPAPGSYLVRPVDSGAVRVPRLWDRLSRSGGRSVVLNVPLTYPATPLNGIMVSGFVAPELTRAVHPPEMLSQIQAMGYRPESDLDRAVSDPAALTPDLLAALEVRLELFERMMAQPWDLCVAVFTETDRINHFLWPALGDDAHPLAEAARRAYRRIDDFLGQVWRKYAPAIASGQVVLMLAADHAFGPIVSEVYLNPWLREQGLLIAEGWQAGPGHERILPASQALALDPGRIYLHWAGRFPGGRLTPGPAAEQLRGRIRAGLLGLRFRRLGRGPDGRPALVEEAPIAAVHDGRQLYHGPQAHLAPDLVAVAAPGYSLRAGMARTGVFGLSHLTGTHRPEGALALVLPPPRSQPANLAGLYRLMATALGLEAKAGPGPDLPSLSHLG